jgi:hypothetical protein
MDQILSIDALPISILDRNIGSGKYPIAVPRDVHDRSLSGCGYALLNVRI